MYLKKVQVTAFKSIEDSTAVPIETGTTVLVGKNESGKTAFLQSLAKARDIQKHAKFNLTDDYPRKNLNKATKSENPDAIVVARLTYSLTEEETRIISEDLGVLLSKDFEFTVLHNYGNAITIGIKVNEGPFVAELVRTNELPEDLIGNNATVRQLLESLQGTDKNEAEKKALAELTTRFKPEVDCKNLIEYYLWHTFLSKWRPYFFYFDDYYVLPGKVNLDDLKKRRDERRLEEEHQTVLSLLKMAEVDLEELRSKKDYESSKAKLEGISNEISDTILRYWPNRDLSVEFDVDTDPHDSPPFNSGQNLYIRIKNSRHRVTLPFSQRSRGFIWFFSFIVWFDVIREQLNTEDDLILLLDEPGLNLHGLAQNELLHYLDDLSKEHQVIYTTHSPFMVDSSHLEEVRTVEDREGVGTKVSTDLQGDDKDTLFPLQAALGYTIAQNLFISKRNLLVEGPADLLYLTHFGNVLQAGGGSHLLDDITIVPVGGLDKVATFIALLRGNALEIVVLHDFSGSPEQRIQDLIEAKIILSKQILNYALFRGVQTDLLPATDVEDLFEPNEYITMFNAAYQRELAGHSISSATLPPGSRIVDQISRWLTSEGISVRPSGGFNHYRVANYFVSHESDITISTETIQRFEKLFERVNSLFP